MTHPGNNKKTTGFIYSIAEEDVKRHRYLEKQKEYGESPR
jgi:hypothetical protein